MKRKVAAVVSQILDVVKQTGVLKSVILSRNKLMKVQLFYASLFQLEFP